MDIFKINVGINEMQKFEFNFFGGAVLFRKHIYKLVTN